MEQVTSSKTNYMKFLNNEPIHTHDCDRCKFVGSKPLKHLTGDSDNDQTLIDIYICEDSDGDGFTVVARQSNEGSDYFSLSSDILLFVANSPHGAKFWGNVVRYLHRNGVLKLQLCSTESIKTNQTKETHVKRIQNPC